MKKMSEIGGMVFPYDIFLSNVDKDINNNIFERYGVSIEVIHMVNELVSAIKDCIEDGEYIKAGGYEDIFGISTSDSYILETSCYLNDRIFELNCVLVDYGNISNEKYDELSVLVPMAYINKKSLSRFVVECRLPMKNGSIDIVAEKTLGHELMHAWQDMCKGRKNKPETGYPDWKKIYNASVDLIRHHKNTNDGINIISRAIYASDLRELASFTQQAYHELKNISDCKTADSKIRTTDLYKNMIHISKGIKFLEDNDIPVEFKCGIPKSKLLFIFKKRYEQYLNNVGKIVMARKEVIEENSSICDGTLLDLMFLRPVFNEHNKEKYKNIGEFERFNDN